MPNVFTGTLIEVPFILVTSLQSTTVPLCLTRSRAHGSRPAMRLSFTMPYLPLCQFGSPASLELFAKLRIALSLIANCQEEPVAQQFCAGNCMFILLLVGTSFHSMYLCHGQHPVIPVTFLFSVFTTLCPILGLSRRFVAMSRCFTAFVVGLVHFILPAQTRDGLICVVVLVASTLWQCSHCTVNIM